MKKSNIFWGLLGLLYLSGFTFFFFNFKKEILTNSLSSAIYILVVILGIWSFFSLISIVKTNKEILNIIREIRKNAKKKLEKSES